MIQNQNLSTDDPKMNPKLPTTSLFTGLIILTLILLYLYSSLLSSYTSSSSPNPKSPKTPSLSKNNHDPHCDFFNGKWVFDPDKKPIYDEKCSFHRNAWNCLRNKRINMGVINNWRWVPESCELDRIDPFRFLGFMRDKNIGFVGDSLNENFLVAFLCVLSVADDGVKKWKRKGAWKGAYFPKFNVTVAYHRAVLLAKYEWQPKQAAIAGQDGLKGIYRVDVDIPADDWVNISGFYDVLVFNTGHWWSHDKFPEEAPLVFYKSGKSIVPPLGMLDGLQAVLENMVSYIQKEFPTSTLKLWRMQSPRHFHNGEWNQNGSCEFDKLLGERELDSWFDPINNGVNKEARELNRLIKDTLQGTNVKLLDLTHMSEFRADAHPAIWLGKKDAVAVWGQDCMHWCLPGVPDTWVDILSAIIHDRI